MKPSLLLCLLLSFNTGLEKGFPSDKMKEADSLLAEVYAGMTAVNPSGVLDMASEALSLSRESGYSRGKAISFFIIGQSLYFLGDYEKSLEFLTLSEKEKYAAGDVTLRSEICRVKGQVYSQLGLREASFQEFRKAYDQAARIRDEEKRLLYTSMAYENLGAAYSLRGKRDSSLYYLRMNEALLSKMDESLAFKHKINLFSHLGEYYMEGEELDSAGVYFREALSLTRKYDYSPSSRLYTHWGDLHMLNGDTGPALACYRKEMESLRAAARKEEMPELCLKISDAFASAGVEDSARYYREQSSLIDAGLARSKSDALEKAVRILLEEERKQEQDRHSKILLWGGMVLLVFFMVRFFFWWRWMGRKKQRLKEKEAEVLELKQKLNESIGEVVQLAKENDKTFLVRFRQVYPRFAKNLLKTHPNLTFSELRLCAMIYLNFSSKDIAQYTFVTHRSVQTMKNRLRKKLGIPGKTDLYQYIKEMGQF